MKVYFILDSMKAFNIDVCIIFIVWLLFKYVNNIILFSLKYSLFTFQGIIFIKG